MMNPVPNGLPKRLKLCPRPGLSPLQDADTGQTVSLSTLGFDNTLSEQLATWNAQYQVMWGTQPQLATHAEERLWVQQGQSIATAIRAQWRGTLVTRLSKLESIVQQSMLALQPTLWYSEAHANAIAKQCGVAEIARAIERLNELAVEKSNTAQWDDDAHEDIAKAQRLLSQTLAALPRQFLTDVAMGLTSQTASTRVYVAIAMAKHGEAALPFLRQARAQEPEPTTAQLLDLVIEPLIATK